MESLSSLTAAATADVTFVESAAKAGAANNAKMNAKMGALQRIDAGEQGKRKFMVVLRLKLEFLIKHARGAALPLSFPVQGGRCWLRHQGGFNTFPARATRF
jgi:hypothetical protein